MSRFFVSYFGNSKVILEKYDFGVYALYFANRENKISTRDDLYDNIDDAKMFCKEDFNISEDNWEELPNHIPIMVTE